MKDRRFYQYKYSLISYFKKAGYIVNTSNRTIIINPDELNRKESERLKQLLNWGFTTKRQLNEPVYNGIESESFVDFADEILSYYK